MTAARTEEEAGAAYAAEKEALKTELLAAFLEQVPFEGWTARALTRAGSELKLDEGARLLAFPGGPKELARFWSHKLDQELAHVLEERLPATPRVRDKIFLATKTRIELMTPHKEALRHGLALLALPGWALSTESLLWQSVDQIWYLAGDRASDYNYYSKRLLLLGVYKATLLYWLADDEPGGQKTWNFLARRLDEVLRFGKSFGGAFKSLLALPDRLVERRVGLPISRRRH